MCDELCSVYRHGDAVKMLNRTDGDSTLLSESKSRILEDVRRMKRYCRDVSSCRRVQILKEFGEIFNKKDCQKRCDVCMADAHLAMQDVTQAAIDAINLINFAAVSGNYTMNYFVEVLLGKKSKKILEIGHDQSPGYGACVKLNPDSVEELLETLIDLKALVEKSVQSHGSGYYNQYLKVRFLTYNPAL